MAAQSEAVMCVLVKAANTIKSSVSKVKTAKKCKSSRGGRAARASYVASEAEQPNVMTCLFYMYNCTCSQ